MDLPSRGTGGSELVKAQLWWKGPGFLTNQEDKWPMTNLNGFCVQARTEIVKGQNPICHSLFVTETSRQIQLDISRVIEVKNFSGFSRLRRITANVLHFVKYLKKCIGEPSVNEEFNNSVGANEIESAELVWIRSVQEQCFWEEIRFLKQSSGKKPLYVKQFGLYLDNDDLIRCRGRINNSSLPLESKNPVFLPAKHDFVRLLIEHTHVKNMHSGARDTLINLRKRYWILKGRQVVRVQYEDV